MCSLKSFELIALLFEPFKSFGQGISEFINAFERIVKRDNGTVADIAFHIIEYVFSGHPFGVVACNKIPHHYLKILLQPEVAAEPQPSVRGAEEVCVNHFVGNEGINDVGCCPVLESAQMCVGVVAHLMSGTDNGLVEFGMPFYVFAHHEEGGFGAVFGKCLQNERGGLGDGAVIEGEIYGPFPGIHSPQCLWVEPPEPLGRLFYEHACGLWWLMITAPQRVLLVIVLKAFCFGISPFLIHIVAQFHKLVHNVELGGALIAFSVEEP